MSTAVVQTRTVAVADSACASVAARWMLPASDALGAASSRSRKRLTTWWSTRVTTAATTIVMTIGRPLSRSQVPSSKNASMTVIQSDTRAAVKDRGRAQKAPAPGGHAGRLPDDLPRHRLLQRPPDEHLDELAAVLGA